MSSIQSPEAVRNRPLPPLRVGVDLIEIRRIERAVERHGQRFLQRVFTSREISAYSHRSPSLAARWAAKEAVAKALGCGIGDVRWVEIEILAEPSGAPQLHLHGDAAARAAALGLTTWAISISHANGLAIAFAAAQ